MKESIVRSISGIVFIAILLIGIQFNSISFLLLFLFFMVVAVFEFSNLFDINKFISISLALILYAIFSVSYLNSNTVFFLLGTTIFATINLIFLLFNKNLKALITSDKYVYLIGYVILPFIILTQIPFVNTTFEPKSIISIFLLIWTNDTFAYIIGKSFGKHKLLEAISPKKTIEGFVGGIIFTIITAILIATYYLEMPLFYAVVIAISVSVFGTLGDLIESKFKRIAGVKDSGNIMPGHGGILDRFDSVIFVAPIIYLFLQLILFFKHD